MIEASERREEQKRKTATFGRTRSSATAVQKQKRVNWTSSFEEHKPRSEQFAPELFLPTPWESRYSLSQLGLRSLERHKAVLVRSAEHMVIMEVEASEEQSKDQPSVVDDTSICDSEETSYTVTKNAMQASLVENPGIFTYTVVFRPPPRH